MALTKPEAETLAKATAEVAKYYPMSIDPKTVAWVNLATCMGLTYGPRVYMIRARLDAERKARGAPQPAPVMQTATGEEPAPNELHMPGTPGYMGPVSEAVTM